MNRRSQDSADELVQALRAKLDKEEGSPDDVFADDSSSARSKQKDDELAAFDAYMAALLGEVVSEQESEPEENEIKHTKSKKKRSSAKKEEKIEQPTVVEGDAIVFSDVDAPEEELLPDDETVLKTDADAETSDATVIEEELPHPDTQVELPDDVIGEERPQIDEVHVTE